MRYNNSRPTEECPLTRNSSYKHKLSVYCGDGLKFIISCFTILTISITTTLILQIFYTEETPQDKAGIHGAVATDYTNCSQIGTKLLRKGGNAVDAAIAATICMSVVAPHKTGLGGGGYVMIYNHKDRTNPFIVDFVNDTIEGTFAQQGMRIPAMLRGLEYAHTLRGRLPWNEVVKPSVTLATEGFVVSKELVTEISKNSDYEILYGHLSAGDILKLHDLGNTLHAVAQDGINVLYNGTFSQKMLQDKNQVSELLVQLANYKPRAYSAERSSFYKHAVYYPPRMSLLQSMIASLENLNISIENVSTIETQIHIAEALIHLNLFPSQAKQNEGERYTGVMAMDWEDTYVCIITGLSAPFGLGYMSNAGFLLDKSDSNNSLSALTPIIFHNEKVLCGLRGVFGTDDTLIIGQLLYSIIVRGLNVSEAIEYPRYYFLPDGFAIESDQKRSVDTRIRNRLQSMTPTLHVDGNLILKSVNAIIKRKDSMSSHSDSRGGGLASRF